MSDYNRGMTYPSHEELARYELPRMRPHQIREARAAADVCFLPLGTLEWHGVQAPIGTDGIKSHHICCVAAHVLRGGAVAPPLYLGVPRDSFDVGRMPSVQEKVVAALGTEPRRLLGYTAHGGIDLQEQWLFYQRLVRMTLDQIAGFGFKSIYICCGHQPLIHFAKPAAIAFTRATMMAGFPVTVDFGGEFEAAGLRGDHGGKWETSLVMAADAESVDLAELERHPDYVGLASGKDAADSSVAQGQAWALACAEGLAREAREMVARYPAPGPRHAHAR